MFLSGADSAEFDAASKPTAEPLDARAIKELQNTAQEDVDWERFKPDMGIEGFDTLSDGDQEIIYEDFKTSQRRQWSRLIRSAHASSASAK